MSAQFTPGPWSIHVEPTYSIYRTPSVYICRGDQPWPDGQLARVNTADEFGSQVANARLIAAAPDGYSASVLAVEHMEWSTPQGRKAYEALKAFIAKARGETSE